MVYLGLDPSLMCTGICILNKDRKLVDYKTLAFGPGNPNRLWNYHLCLYRYIMRYSKMRVGIEHYAFGKAGASMAFNIGELGGAVKTVFQRKGITNVIKPLPTEVKKFITGQARAEKEKVRKWLENSYGYKIKWKDESQIYDLYDALAVALVTYYFYRRKQRKDLQEEQIEILKKIEKRVRKESLKISR